MSDYKRVKLFRQEAKKKLVAGFGGKCAICDKESHPIIYDFHHLDADEKKFNIGQMLNKSWDALVKEASKCVMLCATCHRLVHQGLETVPIDACRFNAQKCGHISHQEKYYDICPICENTKPKRLKVCSPKCSQQIQSRVEWDKLDLFAMLKEQGSAEKVGLILGVSGTAVRKQIKRRGIIFDGRDRYSVN